MAEICDWYLEKAESGELLGRRRRPIAQKTLMLDRTPAAILICGRWPEERCSVKVVSLPRFEPPGRGARQAEIADE